MRRVQKREAAKVSIALQAPLRPKDDSLNFWNYEAMLTNAVVYSTLWLGVNLQSETLI